MHLALSAGDLDDLHKTSAQFLNLPNGTTVVARAVSTNGAAIDIFDVPVRTHPINVKKFKRDASSRVRVEAYVHAIPFIVLLCYFCLWMASSGT